MTATGQGGASTYDVEGELRRYAFPDVERGGVHLNRGTARPAFAAAEPAEFFDARASHDLTTVRTTLPADAPVVELDRPATGIYVASRRGVYLDLYQGVAQRLFDDDRLRSRLEPLIDSGLLLRREINTDDYLGFAPAGVRLPSDLASLVLAQAQRELPRAAGYQLFFSNSGTEAVEAALKAATLVRYRRFVEEHGPAAWAGVCNELGIEANPYFGARGATVWRDYPLFIVALEGAFHGRTLGSLGLTLSREAQKVGFPAWRWTRHVPPAGGQPLDFLVDETPIDDVLAVPGRLRSIVAAGRIPAALLAGAIFEPFQGEGGYRHPDRLVIRGLADLCTRHGALLIADEVQTFARTGRVFYSSAATARPDIVCLAKSSVVGLTLLPADHANVFGHGWHSNTFGSGRLFDVNYAYAVWDTFVNGREPLFEGRSFAENEQAKGSYLGERLAQLARGHADVISEPDGAGCIWGFTAVDRGSFIREGWKQGAKLLGAGATERPGRIRLILPADVLTKEVDDVIDVLDRTCRALEERPR